jgi:hypothetical protein
MKIRNFGGVGDYLRLLLDAKKINEVIMPMGWFRFLDAVRTRMRIDD